MSLFSSVYAERNAEVRAALDSVRCPSPSRVEEILAHSESGDALGLAELAELLEIGVTRRRGLRFQRSVRNAARAHSQALARAQR